MATKPNIFCNLKVAKNLIYRILTGIVFVSVILSAILFGKNTYALIFGLIEALALLEFYKLIEKFSTIKINRIVNVIGGVLLFVAAFIYQVGWIDSLVIFTPYIIYLLILFILELYQKKDNPILSLGYSVLGQFYIAIPFSLLSYLAFSYNGEYHYVYILALLVLIWVDDSFAYLCGVTMGKHKMFERISPKKSWEGFIGGAVCTVLASIVFSHYFTELPTWAWIGFAIVIITFGTWGDLVESLFKRTLKVKDSGSLLPGHGGILDRFDSMIMAIPALSVYLCIINYFTGK